MKRPFAVSVLLSLVILFVSTASVTAACYFRYRGNTYYAPGDWTCAGIHAIGDIELSFNACWELAVGMTVQSPTKVTVKFRDKDNKEHSYPLVSDVVNSKMTAVLNKHAKLAKANPKHKLTDDMLKKEMGTITEGVISEATLNRLRREIASRKKDEK